VNKDLHLEIIQVKEKREQRHTQVCFNIRKTQESVGVYGAFRTHPRATEETVTDIRGSQWGKSWIFVGHGRDNSGCLEKCARIDCTVVHPLTC
jgi:hypothetical protein